MKTRTLTSVLFILRYSKTDRKAPGKIYCRITRNGLQATPFTTGVCVRPEQWNAREQRVTGTDVEACSANETLTSIRADLRGLARDNPEATADRLKSLYCTPPVPVPTLMQVWQTLVDHKQKTRMTGTYKNWKYSRTLFGKFLESIGRKDYELSEIPRNTGGLFEEYLQAAQRAGVYVFVQRSYLNAVLEYAVNEGYLSRNPIAASELERPQPGEIAYLTEYEVERLYRWPFKGSRLQRAADVFVFQCFTGMAYAEVMRFNAAEHLVSSTNGRRQIRIHRQKTGNLCVIPLLPTAREILDKYDGRLPRFSNDELNDAIKAAAEVAGLDDPDRICTHLARKTAGTYLLNQDVPIKTVSQILGHSSVLTTEKLYARLLDSTVDRHTAHLMV